MGWSFCAIYPHSRRVPALPVGTVDWASFRHFITTSANATTEVNCPSVPDCPLLRLRSCSAVSCYHRFVLGWWWLCGLFRNLVITYFPPAFLDRDNRRSVPCDLDSSTRPDNRCRPCPVVWVPIDPSDQRVTIWQGCAAGNSSGCSYAAHRFFSRDLLGLVHVPETIFGNLVSAV